MIALSIIFSQSVGVFFRAASAFILRVQYPIITSDQHCKIVYMKKDLVDVVGVRASRKTRLRAFSFNIMSIY